MEHEDIIAQFELPGAPEPSSPYGSGLINDTYLCRRRTEQGERRYLLQRINGTVFARPEEVMENVEAVTEHIRSRLLQQGVAGPDEAAPELVRTKDGRSFLRDGRGDVWRMFHFIESGEVFDAPRNEGHAFEVGRAIGRFQALLSDLPPARLHDTLPGFHHTPNYLAALDDAARRDAQGRASSVREDLAFVDRRRGLAMLLMDAAGSGAVPLRVVHNDPKVNNVLVHRETGKALCMVDLDTVKPGIVHFDYGDCVRSAANPAGEDAPDLGGVSFERTFADAITRGYLEEAGGFLTRGERELLPVSPKVITFELGMRFLADHLRGDAYFRITRPGQNLHRARVQFRLLEGMEAAGL